MRCHPHLPANPQLPNRSMLERRLPQAAWGIEGVSVMADGSLQIDSAGIDREAPYSDPTFAGEPFATLRTFLAAMAQRRGPAKFQLTGPVTLGVALTLAGLAPEVAFALSGTVVRSRARDLLALVAQQAPEVAPLVFVDEPSLLGSSAGLLWRQLSALWCALVQGGCDAGRLRSQALVTPAGGLGWHSVEQAGVVLALVDELAQRLYDQATGLRLSVGA